MQYLLMPTTSDHRRKGTQKLRLGRHSNQNQIYHVNTTTHQRAKIFGALTNGRFLTRAMMRSDFDAYTNTLAFVIMPDHLHWLVQLTGSRPLSKCVGIVKSESARKINRQNGCTNQIWQRGFYDRAIRYEDDIADVARYIIQNPVRAGIAKTVRHYALWDSVWV
jgi:putative transposase